MDYVGVTSAVWGHKDLILGTQLWCIQPHMLSLLNQVTLSPHCGPHCAHKQVMWYLHNKIIWLVSQCAQSSLWMVFFFSDFYQIFLYNSCNILKLHRNRLPCMNFSVIWPQGGLLSFRVWGYVHLVFAVVQSMWVEDSKRSGWSY